MVEELSFCEEFLCSEEILSPTPFSRLPLYFFMSESYFDQYLTRLQILLYVSLSKYISIVAVLSRQPLMHVPCAMEFHSKALFPYDMQRCLSCTEFKN